jgi:2-oxoisovalerate dehydrogenase E1 component alpha subunit
MAQVEKAHGDEGLDGSHVLSDPKALQVYSQMVLVRTFDERIWALNRQGKVPIAASCQGHEAAQLGSLLAAQDDGDFFLFPYYRDLAIKLTAGISVDEAMLSFMGKAGDPYSGGRQFPLQGASPHNRVIQTSNVVAANLTQAVGYALGCRALGEDTVVLAYLGDGGSSQGECHEAMNFAAVHRLPVIFICENNRYAISVPLRLQMSVPGVTQRAQSYGFPGHEVDGLDLFECYRATCDAIAYARSEGPVLLEMQVERLMPHTTDDDDRRYRSTEELEAARTRDPIDALRNYLLETGHLTESDDEMMRSEARVQVDRATALAEDAPLPDPSTFYHHLYAG